MMASKYKAIDFFCGGGGMTCGLRQAGINVIAGVDFDQDAKETYEYNNSGSVFIQTNIKNLRSNYFERKFGIRKNDDFLILVGCSPCQFYSIINTDTNTHPPLPPTIKTPISISGKCSGHNHK